MARKDITMTEEEISRFLDADRTLQVASVGRDGYPHLAPMWYVVDDGRVVFRSFTKSQKIVNLTRNPKVTVLVEEGEAYSDLRGVTIEGDARLVTDRAYVLEVYGRLAARYPMMDDQPVELDAETLEATWGRYAEKNTAVIVEPRRVVSWDHRKLAGGY
ncbi:MAG TPA: pyridoxamine 5'-phosphate oxidase family protein [Acidimicrobiia bacterium]|jgi:PPOX class probable F420-dependent enzyme